MQKSKWLPQYTIGIILLVYLGGMVVINLLTPDRSFSELENRVLEQRPSFSLDELIEGYFTVNYEKYIADQFAMKDFWVGVKSSLEKALGKKEYNGVYLGKDGYLLPAFKEPDEQSFQSKLELINTFGKATPQINKYFMLIPNSEAILDRKLPPYVASDSEQKWLARVKNSLDKSIQFVDVFGALEAKQNEYVYYKTDHHWTTKGAYYTYQRLIKTTGGVPHAESYYSTQQVTDSFYGSLHSKAGLKQVSPDSIDLYIPKKQESYQIEYFDEEGKAQTANSLYNLENIKKKDKYSLFLNGNHPLIKITTKGVDSKKLLVIKDSYANCLIPFLTSHYSQIFVVDLRYYYDSLITLIKENHIRDMLLVYNINSFFGDTSVESLMDYTDFNQLNEMTTEASEGGYKEFFKQDVFMGDSITEAISYLDLLDQANVCATIGININEAKSQISSIKISNPRNIYLLYGVNDMDDRTDSNWFVGQYRELVRSLKVRFPEAQIYVQSVLPVAAKVERQKPHTNNRHIYKCNEGLAQMAAEERVEFIDIASLINDTNKKLYDSDGIHFKAPFYQLWFNYLIDIVT
ncbi:hypothetical protein JCM14036_32520 [Desulfotomaculum defluvii]